MCSDREEPTGRLRSALLVTKCKLILVLKKEGSDIFFFLQAFSCCLLAVQGRANPKPLHHGSLLRCLPPKQESAGVQRSSRDSKKGITNLLPKDAAIPTKSFSLQNAVSLERLMEFDMLITQGGHPEAEKKTFPSALRQQQLRVVMYLAEQGQPQDLCGLEHVFKGTAEPKPSAQLRKHLSTSFTLRRLPRPCQCFIPPSHSTGGSGPLFSYSKPQLK